MNFFLILITHIIVGPPTELLQRYQGEELGVLTVRCNCGQLLHHQLPHTGAHTSFFLCFTMWVDGYKITVVTPLNFSWSLSFFFICTIPY